MVLANFDQLLDKYAHLIVHKALTITDGDYVHINTDVDQVPLTRLLVRKSYEAGAAKVYIDWSDDQIGRDHIVYQSDAELAQVTDYEIARAHDLIDKRAKRIALRSSDPNAYQGVDPHKINVRQLALSEAMKDVRLATQANVVSWVVVCGAGEKWAELVFPDLESTEAQVDALWDQIFKTTRVYAEDPVKAWDDHEETLQTKARFLNEHQFDALHYTGPGTDFTIGLPVNHLWEAANSYNQKGEKFIANMPTEEVFTSPDCWRADGVITSSKPLSYGGHVIDQMTFRFKDGEIIKAEAVQGEETLQKLVNEQAGATRLGEVALVPHHSPISQSGITFYNTLFDENASNHLAIGQAYAFTIEGGTEMTQEELQAAGLNRSNVHVDFMVGNGEMNVDGITKDGQVIPIMRQGEWAF